MLGFLATVSSVVASVSGIAAEAAVPVLGSAVAASAEAIGSAVTTAITSSGGSSVAGVIAGNTAQTAINGAAIHIATSDSD